MRRIWALIFALSLFIPALRAEEFPKALWSSYGMQINDTPGNSSQQHASISVDHSGAIIVWEDERNGYSQIYAQKMEANGRPAWDQNGIAIARSSDTQNFARVISDGAGGAIITWQDNRSGNTDIYAQKIDAGGTVLWGNEGKIVCSAEAAQLSPEIIPDSADGVIITWFDYRSGKGEDIYAQRMDANGNPLWQKNGAPICTADGTQWYPKLVSDGAGGALIAWTDGRISSSDNNIYSQRINANGKTLWQKDGVAVCSAPNNQERVEILFTSNGAILAWNDLRSGNSQVYAQKINRDGNPLWQKDGVAVCISTQLQEEPRLAPDGEDGAMIVWGDGRSEYLCLYGQHLLADGRIGWQEDGRPISKASGNHKNHSLLKLSNDAWLVLWEDNREDKANLFAQKINSSGIPLWQEEGIKIAAAPQKQELAVMGASPAGEVFFAWQDNRQGNFDIYSQKLAADGNLAWEETGSMVCNATGAVAHQNLQGILNGAGEIILVWEDARSGFFNIYGQKIDKAGRLAWGADGIPIARVAGNQANPRIISDGVGGVIIVWEDYRNENFPAIRAQRIHPQGTKAWEGSLLLANLKSRQTQPALISDGAGGAIAAWVDERDPLSLQDIYAQRISGKGELLWGKNGKALSAENSDQNEVTMAMDGVGGAYLTWTDYRRGDRNPDIYAQKINSKGDLQWQSDGVAICGAPDIQRSPAVIGAGEEGAIITWSDKGGGSYDIYAQRLSKAGKVLWMTDGIPVCQVPRTQQNPKLGNRKIIVWEDYRYGNWDIFAEALDASGKLLWGEGGVPVVTIPLTQYTPQIIPWKNGEVIVAWEDYRSGKQYEIYIQKIDDRGKPTWAENGLLVQSRDGSRAPRSLANPSENIFYVFWEDFSDGHRAIFGQKFSVVNR